MKPVVHVILKLVYWLSGLMPRNHNLILFGAWFGTQVGDNPGYLLQSFLNKKSQNRYIWIGDPAIKEQVQTKFNGQVTFCSRNTLRSFYYQLRAGYAFVNQGVIDFGYINLLKGAILVQLWHGFPIKKIVDDMGKPLGKRNYHHYDYYLATSPLMAQRLLSAFKSWGATETNIIGCLQPRNQILLSQQSVIPVRQALGVSSKQKIVLYLPTFRDNGKNSFDFHQLSTKLKIKLSKENIAIIQKKHFAEHTSSNYDEAGIIDIPTNFTYDTQMLLKSADVLVSDFSSAYVDFLLLDRPLIHYLYDYQEYVSVDRGLYPRNFADEAGGAIVTQPEQLVEKIILACIGQEDQKYVIKRRQLNKQLNYFYNRDSANTIINKLPGLHRNFD